MERKGALTARTNRPGSGDEAWGVFAAPSDHTPTLLHVETSPLPRGSPQAMTA